MMPAPDQSAVAEGGGQVIALTAEQFQALQEQQQKQAAERADRLNALGLSLSTKRKEAIDGRKQSGIEDDWLEDENSYQGLDEASEDNKNAWSTKPPGSAGVAAQEDVRSTVFLNITRPYCDAAAARLGDMLLPTDDKPWSIRPTPVPELEKAADSQRTMMINGQTVPESAVAQKIMDEAKDKAERAEKRIEDWLVESQWHSQVRKVIDSSAKLGSGVLKGPFPQKKRRIGFEQQNGVTQISISENIQPHSKAISVWNLYPDPSCGESIHDGSYVWERDTITRKGLRELMDGDYIDDQIDECLKEGPQKPEVLPEQIGQAPPNSDSKDADQFEIWYYVGTLEKEDIEAAGCSCDQESDPHVPAIITMVNHRVIKAALNPDDSGSFPYDVMPWRQRFGMPWGAGVAREIRTPQRMINAGTRHMMDNAGMSAGPQIVVRHGVITPADGTYEITPRKVWFANKDADIQQVQHAFIVVNIPTMQKELLAIIEFALKMAEEVTGFPALIQGQQTRARETLGVVQILNNNASSVLRRVAKLFDDHLTEPHITRYYQWLMLNGPDESEKGDYTIDARGSSALVERDMQNQFLPNMAKMVMNPVFGLDPKKWAKEMLAAQHLDINRFEYDDEEWQKIVEKMQQPPQDPRLQVAQMSAQVKQAELQQEADQAEKDRQHELLLAGLDAELQTAAMNGEKVISMDKIKALLAQTTISERNKRDLFAAERALKLATGTGI